MAQGLRRGAARLRHGRPGIRRPRFRSEAIHPQPAELRQPQAGVGRSGGPRLADPPPSDSRWRLPLRARSAQAAGTVAALRTIPPGIRRSSRPAGCPRSLGAGARRRTTRPCPEPGSQPRVLRRGRGALGPCRRAVRRRRGARLRLARLRTTDRRRATRSRVGASCRPRHTRSRPPRSGRPSRVRRRRSRLLPPRAALRRRSAPLDAPAPPGCDRPGRRRRRTPRRRDRLRPQRRDRARRAPHGRGGSLHLPVVRQAQGQPGSLQARARSPSGPGAPRMSLDGTLAWLEHDDTHHVRSALITLSESDRKALGPKARGWLTRGHPTRISSTHAALAVLATAGGWRQAMIAAKHAFGLDHSYVDHAVTVLQARDPDWLPKLVNALLEAEGSWNWRLARGLVRAGAVPAPDHPGYFRGTVRGLPDYLTKDRRPLIDQVDADPDLAREHLIRMLATEGSGRLLAYHDTFHERSHEYLPHHTPLPAATWRATLLVLSQQGRLDRGRLIDAVLAAPLRDWSTVDLGWYVGMHDALEPTLDEIADRQGTYVRLLAAEHGPSVKTAQRELTRLMPDSRFEPEPFLAASRATLGRSDKATVTAQLRLLEKLARQRPEVSVVETVGIAGDHARADVRARAAKILARLGAEVAPGHEPPPFVPAQPESRAPAAPVHPVGTADELAEVLLGLLEEIDPVELERATDGLLRLADVRPSTADLLLARAAAADYYQAAPRLAARVLTLAWLTPRKRVRHGDWPIVLGHTIFPAEAAAPQTFVGAIGRRVPGIAFAVREGSPTSLALPTRTDFSLDAGELNRRLAEVTRSHPILEVELAIALLRVPASARTAVTIPRSMR